MKNLKLVALLLLGVAALCVNSALAGNGSPSGRHYNLNIIGHDNCPGDDLTGSNRHVIAVKLNGKSKINLAEDDFRVADGNACDGSAALFYLPANPFNDGDGDPNTVDDITFQEYEVFIRDHCYPVKSRKESIGCDLP